MWGKLSQKIIKNMNFTLSFETSYFLNLQQVNGGGHVPCIRRGAAAHVRNSRQD